ncbi:MAG TPA: CBS domain-containing protein, partial [Blastocatellia bacterium]|nr:CBS domain-containing protein [Blastocatellia bacterium]
VDVIREMGDHQIRRVPVVDGRDRLVGIIAMADIATQTSKDRELTDALEEISQPSSFFGRLGRLFSW